ncbi:unnamed protein product [Coffea canephora]|uniref:CobW C-terminal domain-containing protein n=1 Tax=Coffea canephora TaxID=49390 RepID=A0A068TS96_COFCA|nr:unnamed protein product [Coffea canephora]
MEFYLYVFLLREPHAPHPWPCLKHHDHHAYDHTHDPGVSSVSIVCEGRLDLERANIWLGTLLLERSEDIYRMKGLLSVDGMNERFVFQIEGKHLEGKAAVTLLTNY